MKIAFLVGNGFDLNLGLNTSYSSFLSWLNSNKTTVEMSATQSMKYDDFKQKMLENATWADMEVALGAYSGYCANEDLEAYKELLDGFQSWLRRYFSSVILNQIDNLKISTSAFYSHLKYCIDLALEKIYPYNSNIADSQVDLYPIVFNYTQTWEKCINQEDECDVNLRMRRVNGVYKMDSIKSPVHIHGSLNNHDIVFGVCDETQIANPEFRRDEAIRRRIIKTQINETLEFNNNDRSKKNRINYCKDIINSADAIYAYGLSFGETDKNWWNAIYDRISHNDGTCLIIFCHSTASVSSRLTNQLIYETKNNFLKQIEMIKDGCNGVPTDREKILSRIYVDFKNFNLRVD